jgi:hypothetical protein
VLPSGVTAPIPVMTTRRFSKTSGDTTMLGPAHAPSRGNRQRRRGYEEP